MRRRLELKMLGSILLGIFTIVLICNNAFAADKEWYVDNTLYSGSGSASGTATAGGNDYICLAGDASTNDDDYNNYGVTLLSGTGFVAGDEENRRIIDYDASGGTCEKYAQVDAAWTTNPDNTTTYEITTGSDSNNGTAEGVYGGANGAWATVQHAFDNATLSGVDEDHSRINIKAGRAYAITRDIDDDTIGNDDRQIRIVQGYASTIGDGTRAVLDGDAGSTQAAVILHTSGDWDHKLYVDLELRDSSTDCHQGSATSFMYRVYYNNCGDYGYESTSGTQKWVLCEFGNLTDGATARVGQTYFCYFHDIAGPGIGYQADPPIMSIIDTTTADATSGRGDREVFIGNTWYNIGDDVVDDADQNQIWINNIFDTVGGDVFEGNAGMSVILALHNVFYDIIGSAYNANTEVWMKEGESTADPELNSSDFTVGSNMDDIGFPTSLDAASGGTTIDLHLEPGAVMYEETAGGGGQKSYGVAW